MSITEWPEDERPREKLLQRGAAALSDAELLAIFLRVGIKGKSAVDLARDMLGHFGGLTPLIHADCDGFSVLPGLGPAKYAQLQAAVELVRRALHEKLVAAPVLSAPDAVRDYLRLSLGHLPHEAFMALFLDTQNRLIAARTLFTGTLSQTSVYPREVVKQALQLNACSLIFAHNHPSGVTEPSQADELLTRTLKQALALVDVRVLDHFVVSGKAEPLSFSERGLL